MKKFLIGASVIASMLSLASCDSNGVGAKSATGFADGKTKLATKADSMSYAFGIAQEYDIERQVKMQAEHSDSAFLFEPFMAGMKHMMNVKDSTAREDAFADAKEIIEDIQKRMVQEEIDKNTAEGNAYLAENKTKEGVKETESGLQYKVLVPTTVKGAKSPNAKSFVEVDYEGKLLNGDIFDSSYQRGQHAVFPLDGVIAGWTEGMQLMKEGDEFEFVIPANLAYGDRGNRGIAPASTLIFKVKLYKVSDKPIEVERPERP